MTANDDTPPEGKDSIDRWRAGEESCPFRDESDEDVALILEGWKTETKDAVDDVTRALLNDGEPLTDGKIRRMVEAAEALEAIHGTLSPRVPDEYQTETEDDHRDQYGDS